MNGPVRIPLSEIDAYTRLWSYDLERRLDFLFYVERLDHEFMTHIETLREQEENLRRAKEKSKAPKRR